VPNSPTRMPASVPSEANLNFKAWVPSSKARMSPIDFRPPLPGTKPECPLFSVGLRLRFMHYSRFAKCRADQWLTQDQRPEGGKSGRRQCLLVVRSSLASKMGELEEPGIRNEAGMSFRISIVDFTVTASTPDLRRAGNGSLKTDTRRWRELRSKPECLLLSVG